MNLPSVLLCHEKEWADLTEQFLPLFNEKENIVKSGSLRTRQILLIACREFKVQAI